MNKQTTFLIASFIFLLTGCIKEPTACISVAKKTVFKGETLTLNSCSDDAVFYEWNIPQYGISRDTKDANINFTRTGDITVNLEVYSKKRKKSDVATETIKVIQGYGDVSFYTNSATNVVDVTIDGVTRTITTAYSSISGCNISGCANFNLESGTHQYYAEEQKLFGATWSGSVTVNADGCTTFRLL